MSSTSRLASTDQAYVDVVNVVLDSVLKPRWPEVSWSFGALEVNDFSFCIAADPLAGPERRGIYIKVPKRRIATTSLAAIDDADRAFGDHEYRSLEFLGGAWPADQDVRYVDLLGRVDRVNAIVTRRVYGEDFSAWLRRVDSQGPGPTRPVDERAADRLRRVGESLVRFHDGQRREFFASEARLTAKFQGYVERLALFGVANHCIVTISRLASASTITLGCRHSPATTTLKGLDVRNLLLESDGRLVFLDPGALKSDSPLADYARFAATLRLLYWGKLPFFLGRMPRLEYMAAFERGYFGGNMPSAARIFELKELCKMWLMAHVALRDKRWPAPFKRFLRSFYVDRFFASWLAEMHQGWAHG